MKYKIGDKKLFYYHNELVSYLDWGDSNDGIEFTLVDIINQKEAFQYQDDKDYILKPYWDDGPGIICLWVSMSGLREMRLKQLLDK